jgi:Rod binding domain-containing protein
MSDLSLTADAGLTSLPLENGAAAQRLLRADRRDTAKVLQAARDFESVLLHRLFEEMRRTIPKADLLDSGTSDQIEGLFWMYLAQHVADQGGIGLGKALAEQMARTSSAAEAAPNLEVEA